MTQAAPPPQPHQQVDVAIICALRKELATVLHVLGGESAWLSVPLDNYEHYHGYLECGGRVLTVVACHLFDMAGDATSTQVMRLKPLRPRLMVMAGICAGWEDKGISLGDVVVATGAFDASRGKHIGDQFHAETITYQPPPWLIQRIKGFITNQDWAATIITPRPRSLRYQAEWLLCRMADQRALRPSEQDWAEIRHLGMDYPRAKAALTRAGMITKRDAYTRSADSYLNTVREHTYGQREARPDPVQSQAHAGMVASGSAVMAVPDPFTELERRVRTVRALDMEIAAFYSAVRELDPHRVIPAFAAKGVSDFGTMEKDDSFHAYACEAAARWMLAFLEEKIGPYWDELFPRERSGGPNRTEAAASPEDALIHAQALLAQMPVESTAIPSIAVLPAGSIMPYFSDKVFVGRTQELSDLAKAFKQGEPTVPTVAVGGIGGVGKTSLAAQFVHHYGQFFAGGVFWLTFDTPSSIAQAIRICGEPGAMNLKDFDRLGNDQKLAVVRAEWQRAVPRLLVFDNCEDEDLLHFWRPTSGGCRVLVTSRKDGDNWSKSAGISKLQLSSLPRGASVHLLQKHRPDLSDADASQIAGELGDLPLALHLAGSFLSCTKDNDSGIGTPQRYLENLQALRLRHTSMQGSLVEPSSTKHSLNVSFTFQMSLSRLREDDPNDSLAQQLLMHAASLAPGELFPRNLLFDTVGLQSSSSAAQERGEIALRTLLDLGLIERANQRRMILHRLICDFVQDVMLSTADSKELVVAAVERALLAQAYQINQQGSPVNMRPIEAHIIFAAERARSRNDERAALLNREAGRAYRAQSLFSKGRPFFDYTLHVFKGLLQPNRADLATSLVDVAQSCFAQMEYSAAEHYYKEALAIRVQILPSEYHPDILMINTAIASILLNLERPNEALQLYSAILAAQKAWYGGDDHPEVALTLANVAVARYALDGDKRAAQVVKDLAQAYHTLRRCSPQDVEGIAYILVNLAVVRLELKQYDDAFLHASEACALLARYHGQHIEHQDEAAMPILGPLTDLPRHLDIAHICTVLGKIRLEQAQRNPTKFQPQEADPFIDSALAIYRFLYPDILIIDPLEVVVNTRMVDHTHSSHQNAETLRAAKGETIRDLATTPLDTSSLDFVRLLTSRMTIDASSEKGGRSAVPGRRALNLHNQIAICLNLRGQRLLADNRLDLAIQLFALAYHIAVSSGRETHTQTADFLYNTARCIDDSALPFHAYICFYKALQIYAQHGDLNAEIMKTINERVGGILETLARRLAPLAAQVAHAQANSGPLPAIAAQVKQIDGDFGLLGIHPYQAGQPVEPSLSAQTESLDIVSGTWQIALRLHTVLASQGYRDSLDGDAPVIYALAQYIWKLRRTVVELVITPDEPLARRSSFDAKMIEANQLLASLRSDPQYTPHMQAAFSQLIAETHLIKEAFQRYFAGE